MSHRIFFALIVIVAALGSSVAEPVPFAIVYGPKAAFNIAAPEGWVIDSSAGSPQGLPCVLYRKGQSWENGDPIMYAKIASTSVEDADAFVKDAIADMKKRRGEVKVTRVESGQTKDGRAWFINEYSPNEKYRRTERVAYVQLPKAVAYIVYTSDDESAFRKHQDALKQLLGSFSYLEPKIEKH